MSKTQMMIEISTSIQEDGFIMGIAWLLLLFILIGVAVLTVIAIVDTVKEFVCYLAEIILNREETHD